MATMFDVRHHRICSDPMASFTLPTAWSRVLEVDQANVDELGLLRLGAGIAQPSGAADFRALVSQGVVASHRAGATFGAIMAGDGDIPVAASVLVTPLAAEPTTVGVLDVQWRVGTDRDLTRVALPVGPALVGTLVHDIEIDDVSSASVYDWQIAIPHFRSGGLLLAFSTPLVPVKEIFDDVFLAIARTVRWRKDWRSS
ncbi:MAG: hypothetical protein JWR83_979 [Aeromicrobium sp.]|nr:hypothetical protein [Aeromicrobium sp.]